MRGACTRGLRKELERRSVHISTSAVHISSNAAAGLSAPSRAFDAQPRAAPKLTTSVKVLSTLTIEAGGLEPSAWNSKLTGCAQPRRRKLAKS